MAKKLYNGKWHDIWDNPKYQIYRDKIISEFKNLEFVEESHQYFVDGRELECVSNVTHLFKEEFDAEGQASRCSETYYNTFGHRYYHMTKDEILEAWKENSTRATTEGTWFHNFGESCFYFMTEQYDKILPDFKDRLHKDDDGRYYFEAIKNKEIAVAKFWEDIPQCIVPILAENKTFIIKDEYAYSGTFDILFYYDALLDGKADDSKSGLIIFDYKTNADLYKSFGYLLEPFTELKDCDLNIYKLQLSLYENNLRNIGLDIIGRRIIWLLPNETYEKISLESYYKTLDKVLKTKKLL